MPKSYGPLNNAILMHHFEALARNKEYFRKPPMTGAGDYSTISTMMTQHPALNGGQPTIIPTVWNGRQLSARQAIREAIKSGQKYPIGDPNQPWDQSPDADWHQYMNQMGHPAMPQNAFLSDKYRFE